MKNRLKTLLCNVVCKGDDRREGGCGLRKDDRCDRIERLDMCMIECITDHLLANGVIVPPVSIVGQTVYIPWAYGGTKGVAFFEVTHIITDNNKSYIRTNFETNDEGFWEMYNGGQFDFEDFGKTVFLTREEAEKALAERSGQ